ncbi:uncharacterized protein LOC128958189 [Oppia nitens]|uniref:uncharacterized protein LOC128958189 n=1 Tax=Oppia nitens TaxID=1686743 RepID=UPI0023DA21BA|nr:uncharacterized protein LOC128958189 [Oppia nitens]
MFVTISYMKLFVLTFVWVAYVRCECEISMEAADKCGMKMMLFGNREATAPTNDAQLDNFCGQARTNMKCVSDFNDLCLKGNVQMAIKIALNNGKKYMDKRCNNPKDRSDFMKHVQCLSPKEKMEPFHVCADKHLVMLSKLRDVTKEDRVPTLCCITHLSQDCLRKQFQSTCGEDTANYWDDSWNELVEENMSFACSNYDSIAKCESDLNPTALKTIKDVIATDDAAVLAQRHKFKSEISTAVELMEFFD